MTDAASCSADAITIEGRLAPGLVANGHRRVRYRGVERNRIALSVRAATINLRRLINLGLTWNSAGWSIAPP